MAAKDKLYRLKVTFLDDGSEQVYTLEKPTDWGVWMEVFVEINDVSGVKAYFPVGSVWVEIT